jgi:hypothetical protein
MQFGRRTESWAADPSRSRSLAPKVWWATSTDQGAGRTARLPPAVPVGDNIQTGRWQPCRQGMAAEYRSLRITEVGPRECSVPRYQAMGTEDSM